MYPATKEIIHERRFDHLNEAQKAAILSEHPHNIVTASAGTGKTSVLTHRIAYLVLEENIMPERILALAFNRKAAVDIRRKLSEVMEDRQYLAERVHVHTFHAVMLRILKGAGNKHRLLVQDWETEMILNPLLRNHHLEAGQGPEVLARLSLIKNKGIPLHQLTVRNEEEAAMVQVMEAYEAEKQKRKVMDFDSMMHLCLEKLATDRSLSGMLAETFEHVLIDEMQDMCQLQVLFLSFLAGEETRFYAVGDAKQSIYGFRGADPRNLLSLQRIMKEPETHRLTLNYRSTSRIIELSNRLMLQSEKEKMTAVRKGGSPPLLIRPENPQEEARQLAAMIRESDTPYCEQRILFRTTDYARLIVEQLVREELPLNVQSSMNLLYDHAKISPLISHLKLITETADKTDLNSVLITLYISPKKCADYLKDKKEFSLDLLLTCGQLDRQEQEWIIDLLELYDEIRDKSAVEAVQEIRRFYYEAYLTKRLPLLSDRRMLLQEMLDTLEDALSPYPSIDDALAFLDQLEEAIQSPQEDGVVLSTIHGAKGLENHTVYLIGAVEGQLPHQKCLRIQHSLFPDLYPGEQEALEEERRLAYVAVTRARDKLVISAPKQVKSKEVEISRFFRDFFMPQNREVRKHDLSLCGPGKPV